MSKILPLDWSVDIAMDGEHEKLRTRGGGHYWNLETTWDKKIGSI